VEEEEDEEERVGGELHRTTPRRGMFYRGFRLGDARWHINASFTLEEVSRLESRESIVKWCGPVAGYSAALEVGKTNERDVHPCSAFFDRPIDDAKLKQNILSGAP